MVIGTFIRKCDPHVVIFCELEQDHKLEPGTMTLYECFLPLSHGQIKKL